MRSAVKAQRQLQDVLEIGRKHHLAPAVSEPVRMQSHKRSAQDREQAKTDPRDDQPPERATGRRLGERVNDPTEQHRFRKLRACQNHIRQGQQPAKPGLVAEQYEHAHIEAY
jgi:hypothetical protein